MSGETYGLVFQGEIVAGFAPETVKAQLAKLLKVDAKKTAALFSGKQIILKKTQDRTAATKYGKALKKIGADVKIRIIKTAAAAAPAPPKASAAPVFQQAKAPEPEAPDIDTSGMTLALNEGDLFDPVPEVTTAEIDLSRFSVAENDDSPLAEPSEEIVLDLDLSEFSIKDNDGIALVEHQDEDIPKVDVPDFGLDEPGAVLETLKEEKVLLNPNTMGMTIAMAGARLLENEPPPRPPPGAPDTSKINLVPNFDI